MFGTNIVHTVVMNKYKISHWLRHTDSAGKVIAFFIWHIW